MPKVEESSNFFDEYREFAYSEGFFGDSPNAEAVDIVLSRYKKNVTEHAVQHYELFTNSFKKERLTSHNLLYYHVYGDYRMILDGGSPKYSYKSVPKDRNFLEDPIIEKEPNRYFLEDYIDAERDGTISGVYNDVTNDGQLEYKIEEVNWLNQEIEREGTGTKFNLPSIGTQIVKLHSFGNASDSIKKALIEEMKQLVAFYEDNYDLLPDYIKIAENDEKRDFANLGAGDVLNENISDLFSVFFNQLQRNPEYIDLHTRQGLKDSLSQTPTNTLRNIHIENQEHDNESAVSKLINSLFGAATRMFDYDPDLVDEAGNTDYSQQTAVMLSPSLNDDKLQKIADFIEGVGPDEGDIERIRYDTFYISGADFENPDENENGYSIRHTDDLTEDILIFVDDNRYRFKDGDLRLIAEFDLEGSGDVQFTGGDVKKSGSGKKKKKKKGKKVLDPKQVVYQRVLLDTFVAFQTLIHLCVWAGRDGNKSEYDFDLSVGRAKAENKMRFLSKGVNTYSLQNQNMKSGGKKKSKLNAIDVFYTFPNMTHFALDRIEGTAPLKKDHKGGNFGLLDELVKWRTYYTLSTLIGIRKKVFNKQLLDDFHSSNMLIAEIKWLTSSLSDNAKFLAKRKQPQDLLAQSEYRMLEPTPRGLTQFAPAPLETVFYDVDVPLLKMVISEYNSAYNKTIIARAFNVQVERDSGFAKKEDIIKILKQAKDFHTKAKKLDKTSQEYRDLQNKKSEKVREAILAQPLAFVVDQPYGMKDGKPSTESEASRFPGVTYKPTGQSFEFHIGLEYIPRDLVGADKIPERFQPDLADPTGEEYKFEGESKNTKYPNEGELAKIVWTSARDRIRGIFDIEGVKPHEFMDKLFNDVETDLRKSSIMRSPFPEAWLGTDTVARLRTDPNLMGQPVDKKYYTERLVEYVDSLKSNYINNWRIPTTLVTSFENATIKYTKDPEILKKGFLERLEKDADRSNLVTTNYVLRPYQITIAIMRNILQIPMEALQEYSAEEIDNEMRDNIEKHLLGGKVGPILPKKHPQYGTYATSLNTVQIPATTEEEE